MEDELDVEVRHADGGAVVRLGGEVDLLTADSMTRALETAFDLSPSVVVDVTAVRFMDSTGVRALMTCLREGRGRSLAVTGAQPHVRRLLEVTGADRVLEIR